MRALVVLVVVVLAACGKDAEKAATGSGTGTGSGSARSEVEALAELQKGADCENAKSPQRIWCIPAEGWAQAKAASLPDASILTGLTVQLADDTSAEQALKSSISLSVLALRDDAGRRMARITSVQPTNNEQATMLLEAIANLMLLFKGQGDHAVIAEGLRIYFATLPAKASYALSPRGPGWTWTSIDGLGSTAELRRVDDFWIAIAVPPGGGARWISIFTDKIDAK